MSAFRVHNTFFVLYVGTVLMTGCAGTAVDVASWSPAAANIAGLRRVAVVQFEGSEELTRVIQHEVGDALSVSGAYQLCDPTRIQMAMQPWEGRSPENVHAALDAARRMGIDSIIIGKAQRKADYGLDLGTMHVRMGDPELAVSIAYELIDVRTGDVRVRKTLNQHFQGEISGSHSKNNSEEKILARLTDKCLKELIAEVAPHELKTKVKLAGGTLGIASGNLRQGNAAAAKGNWAAARQEWQTVLHANPDSHAAHHNLGVAAEMEGDLSGAAAAYREAQRRAQKDLYRNALARVERAAEGQRLVFAQRSVGHQMAAQPPTQAGTGPVAWNQPPASWPLQSPPVYQPLR